MTTLSIRPASQLRELRSAESFISLGGFKAIQSTNYEVEATFKLLSGNEKFTFNVRESPNSAEITKVYFDLSKNTVTVDRTHSSLESFGASFPESGSVHLSAGEDLHVRIFVDQSLVEVFVNSRFALSSRIYPSLDSSKGASYDFRSFDDRNVEFECWEGLRNAWPRRNENECFMEDMPQLQDMKDIMSKIDSGDLIQHSVVYV